MEGELCRQYRALPRISRDWLQLPCDPRGISGVQSQDCSLVINGLLLFTNNIFVNKIILHALINVHAFLMD